jgi:TolB protein
VLDLKSGKKVPMGRYKGMTFAPRFTPDDRGLIVANAKDNGGTQLMYVDLRRAQARPITHTKGSIINTSPTLSPDGKFIIFVSDRTGRCALYKKALNDWQSEATRISFAEGSYAAPAWSPRGDLIGFTKVYGGLFSIGVMNPDGSGERILTSNYHSEGAEWAPNGRRLIFYRQFPQKTGDRSLKSRLFTIDLTGHHERRVPVLSDKRLPGVTGLINPAWSPSLPLG